MYGCKLLCAFPPPVACVVCVDVGDPPATSIAPVPPGLSLVFNECVCDGISLVVNVCVFAPPVSSAVSKSVSVESKPTTTLPAPKATHVPKPSNVPGLVALVALI